MPVCVGYIAQSLHGLLQLTFDGLRIDFARRFAHPHTELVCSAVILLLEAIVPRGAAGQTPANQLQQVGLSLFDDVLCRLSVSHGQNGRPSDFGPSSQPAVGRLRFKFPAGDPHHFGI
jgi:hypothetical protein